MSSTSNVVKLNDDGTVSGLPLSPVGYRLLIALAPAQDKSDGGILYSDDHKAREHTASICGNVLAMGPDAYKDETKFPNGPYCALGDWVMFKSYAGIRLKVGDQELRIINDDTVEAVVDDPRLIKRA